jgi:hypothetical protein
MSSPCFIGLDIPRRSLLFVSFAQSTYLAASRRITRKDLRSFIIIESLRPEVRGHGFPNGGCRRGSCLETSIASLILRRTSPFPGVEVSVCAVCCLNGGRTKLRWVGTHMVGGREGSDVVVASMPEGEAVGTRRPAWYAPRAARGLRKRKRGF